MTDPRVVVVSSALDDTPEAMHRLDRIIAADAERRAGMTPTERALEDAVALRLERAALGY